nr:hypothetical protein [Mycolicibacterium chubuense]
MTTTRSSCESVAVRAPMMSLTTCIGLSRASEVHAANAASGSACVLSVPASQRTVAPSALAAAAASAASRLFPTPAGPRMTVPL